MRTVLAFVAALAGLVLLLPLLFLVMPLWLVAACTRALARLFEPSYVTREQLIQFDPAFGWRPYPNLDTHHLAQDIFQISTDSQGWRGRTTLEDSDLVVFGDSFAAGYGVGDDDLFANLTASPRIKPIGIGGYSMVQGLLWMKELAPALRGKLVVWFVYLGNDLYDNLTPEFRGYRKPFARELRGTDDWEIVSHHVSLERWPIVAAPRQDHFHMVGLAELCSDTFLAQRAYRACEFLIRQAREVCASAGARFVVLSVPDPHQLSASGRAHLRSLLPAFKEFDPDQPDRRIADICRALDVPFVDGKAFLDVACYLANDCHWNELGHRKVAARLTDLYASHKPIPRNPAPFVQGPRRETARRSHLVRATEKAGTKPTGTSHAPTRTPYH
jgi:hypothetical protein